MLIEGGVVWQTWLSQERSASCQTETHTKSYSLLFSTISIFTIIIITPELGWAEGYFRMRAPGTIQTNEPLTLTQLGDTIDVEFSVLLSSSLHCAKLERFTIKSYLPQCIKGWMQRSAFFSLNLFRRENFRSKLFSRNSERRRRWGGGCQGGWYREQFCPRDICRSGNTDPVCLLCWGILTQSKTF